jgi:hypothetical protein
MERIWNISLNGNVFNYEGAKKEAPRRKRKYKEIRE